MHESESDTPTPRVRCQLSLRGVEELLHRAGFSRARRDDRRYPFRPAGALIASVPRANGAALWDVFRRWQDNPALDDDFAERVAAARTAVSVQLGTDQWRN